MKVAFVATRIAGLDGVSLEIDNWQKVFKRMGHETLLIAGQLDRAGLVVPELHFQLPNVARIYRQVIESKKDFERVEVKVFELAGKIEGLLRQFLGNGKKPDLIVASNVFSLPMHFPLSVGLARFIEEYKIPTIARHHDFWWERERFLNSKCFDFFKRWFPPNLAYIKHITINSIARDELFKRLGINSEVIWDSFDFENKNFGLDKYALHWRGDFGISSDDIVFLQTTRIVPRKRLELAVELVRKLNNPKVVLVFAGHSGDEGYLYLQKVKKIAYRSGIRCKFISRFVNSRRRIVSIKGNGLKRRRIYTLWDCYLNSDFLVYPTECEGFGNQFVESVFFKKPLILTPYPVYKSDIKPLGFKAIEIDEEISRSSVLKVKRFLEGKENIAKIVDDNFKLGKEYLSYEWVESKLRKILESM